MLYISTRTTFIRLLLILTIGVSGLSIVQVSQASITLQAQNSEKTALARQLINIDGSKQGYKQANQVGIELMRNNMPMAPNEFFCTFIRKP